MRKFLQPIRSLTNTQASSARPASTLRERVTELIPEKQQEIMAFRKEHGETEIGKINVNMLYGGMRGMKSMVWETSVLDADEGIRFQGKTIPECQEVLPTAIEGGEPLPEALFWLLVTGEVPTKEETTQLSRQWAERASIPQHVSDMLDRFPKHLHPMAQFAAAINALNSESEFAAAYAAGTHKSKYWEHVFEDSTSLIAKLPTVAAKIYNNMYRDGKPLGVIDLDKDWSHNFTEFIGYNDPQFVELMRLYLTIHSDHEGGNVSAHTSHLVGSALSDPYLSFSAALNGLAGPLH